MKKVVSILMIAVLLALLAACGGAAEPSSENKAEPSTDASQPLSPSEDASTSEAGDRPIYDEAEVITQIEQVAETCADIIDAFVIDIDKGMYPMPTLEEYAMLSKAIGAMGYPVACDQLDMPNHERVVAFSNDVQAGKDAQINIYSLHNTGIYAHIIINRDGELYGASAINHFPDYYTQDEKKEVEIYDPLYKIDNLQMTDNGMLFYHIPEQDGKSEQYRGYRVMPIGEENRGYTRKYVDGLGDAPGNILGETWDKDNFGDLSMIHVFDSLYYKVHEDFPVRHYATEHPGDGEAIMQVPADVLEGIMLSSLPITTAQLREYLPYDESQKTYNYHWMLRSSMGYYDVVKSVKNADGSLTLTIDVIPVYYDYNDICTYSLTVMDNPDGSIKYISNVVMM